MYPANQYMDPYYSHFRDYVPYSYCTPPRCEADRPRMTMDTSYRPPSYGSWPYNASMSHPHAPEFHSCCNHSYPPGHCSFRHPFPQELPPAHLYYHGPYPHHPNNYPSYFAQPQPYPVDQTHYGHDKFNSHCCGCPNHVCHWGEKNNVKIEEERPEVKPENEQKDGDNSKMIRHPNYQYPVIWLPSGNMLDKEKGRSFELSPQLFSGPVPVSSKRTENVKQQEQEDQKVKQSQWPIIWMPSGYNEGKRLEEIDQSSKVSEEAPPSPKIKIIPFSWFENGGRGQKPRDEDSSGDHNDRLSVKNHSGTASNKHQDARVVEAKYNATPLGPEKENEEKKLARENYRTVPVLPKNGSDEKKPVGSIYRTIPVVSVKENDDRKPDFSEKEEQKANDSDEKKPVGSIYRTIPVVSVKENDDSKPDFSEKEEQKARNTEREGEKGKRNTGEPLKAKHPKLPPVCLRVDPLPRKKSGNGSSRSPSPPAKKEAERAKDIKEVQSQKQGHKRSEQKKVITVSEDKSKSPDIMNKGMECSNETVQAASVMEHTEKEVAASVDDQKVQDGSINVHTLEVAGEERCQGCDNNTKEDDIKIQGESAIDNAGIHKVKLSELDAAVRIQSAIRGYNIRRWNPLEKLRKIKSVHEQMQDVKQQLQGFEAYSRKPTPNEQVAIGETIMSLLLKLDTIQGLHPSVRETRKSIARELVCLQEKLDSLCMQPNGEPDHTKSEEERPEKAGNDIKTKALDSTAKASDEEKTVKMSEAQGSSSMDSKDHDDFISGGTVELKQDVGSTEQNLQVEESSTIKEEATYEEKAAAQGQCQGSSLIDVINFDALPIHSIKPKHQTEESNTISREESPEEEESAASGGRQEVLVGDTKQSHDAQCTASTEHNCQAEESNGVAPAATGDGTADMATASMDGSVEGQVLESATVESSSELKHDVAPAVEDQCMEPGAKFDHLENSSVSSKVVDPHEHDLAAVHDCTISSPEDQPARTTLTNMQQQGADTTQGSNKQVDGIAEQPSIGDANNMDSAQSPMLEGTSQSNSVLVLGESEVTKQLEVSSKDDSRLVDQQNEPHAENSTGGSAIEKEEAETNENTLNFAAASSDIGTEPTQPENENSELPCERDGTMMHYNPDLKVSTESQSDTQKENVSGEKTSGGMDAAKATEHCGINNPKEDAGVQATSDEVDSACATHDGLKNNEEMKLVEENQKLKEMLQKLLASGNDQMGVITELSEKVKTLERKLARKRRPKFRVHRSSARNATAQVH